jgi:type IV secretion system protein VirB1
MFVLPPLYCAGLPEVETMAHIVRVESSGNPFAIGVVGGRLQRQPANLQEAVQTVERLERSGYNYSIGLSQVNHVHFKKLGWDSDIKKGFDRCENLRAGADVLKNCKTSAARSTKSGNNELVLRAALSCYYSGNFVDGERAGYVDKVLSSDGKIPTPRAPRPFRSMFD